HFDEQMGFGTRFSHGTLSQGAGRRSPFPSPLPQAVSFGQNRQKCGEDIPSDSGSKAQHTAAYLHGQIESVHRSRYSKKPPSYAGGQASAYLLHGSSRD